MTRAGCIAGDLLRRGARTSRETLPRPRRISATETLAARPGLRPAGLRGGLLSWDGQLEDDARLVTTIARTAASYGAHVRTRARVLSATGTAVRAARRAHRRHVPRSTARAVVNATGVWAGDLVDEVDAAAEPRHPPGAPRPAPCPACRVAVTAPVPGEHEPLRAWCCPSPTARIYVGLTDEPVDGAIPDVPDAVRARDRLPARRRLGGLRPRPCAAPTWSARTPACGRCSTPARRAERDRRPVPPARGAHLRDRRGHDRRRQADDVPPDGRGRRRRRVADAGLDAGPCRTRTLPAAGAASRDELARLEEPARLVRRYGTDAELVLAAPARSAACPTTSCSPRSPTASRSRSPSWSSASPTRAPPTSTTCSTGVPASAWSPPTATSPCPAAERALALAGHSPDRADRVRQLTHGSADEFAARRRSVARGRLGDASEERPMRTASDDPTSAHGRARRLPDPDPALPARAARALLPDERLACTRRRTSSRRRSCAPGRRRPTSRAAPRCGPGSTGSPPTSA